MDSLFYRRPNETDFHHETGSFKSLKSGQEPNGFVISDFLHQQIWCFDSSETSTEIHFHTSDQQPVVISKRDYQIESQAMLHAFHVFGVQKAVYSRVKSVQFSIENAQKLFEELCEKYPNAFCYLVSSVRFGTWIGATPELLLQASNQLLKTVALASTHVSGAEINWNVKENNEHAFVIDALEETLQRNGCTHIEHSQPYPFTAGPVTHLKTDFSANLNANSAWKVAMDLHPTPAVCGTPRMAALDLISSREMHKRDLYTGMIGFHSPDHTELYVNLRCSQLFSNQAFLYVGGGFTIDSIPDLEWEETENKALTLLNCMK